MDFLNNLFDDLEKTVTDASRTVVRKTKELSEINRLKNLMHTCEEVMDQKYREIGKAYYEAHKDEPEDPYAEECKAVTDAQAGLEALREQLDAVRTASNG